MENIFAGGNFESNSILLENGTELLNSGNNGGMIIKISNKELPEVTVKKAIGIGGTEVDAITAISQTSDGGYIVGGNFDSSTIDLGNGITLSNGRSDGMLIKYDENDEVEWAKTSIIGINGQITSVSETSDGGCICRRRV